MADWTREDFERWRQDWVPFGFWSDLECTEPGCEREALEEDGRRIDYCHAHLAERLHRNRGSLAVAREELVLRRPVIDARDLTPQQRAWTPDDILEWPHADRIEVWSPGVIMYENRWQAPWTWRSVAAAARTYPDRRVRLVNCYLQVPADPDPRYSSS